MHTLGWEMVRAQHANKRPNLHFWETHTPRNLTTDCAFPAEKAPQAKSTHVAPKAFWQKQPSALTPKQRKPVLLILEGKTNTDGNKWWKLTWHGPSPTTKSHLPHSPPKHTIKPDRLMSFFRVTNPLDGNGVRRLQHCECIQAPLFTCRIQKAGKESVPTSSPLLPSSIIYRRGNHAPSDSQCLTHSL